MILRKTKKCYESTKGSEIKISVTNTPKDSSDVQDLEIIKLEIMLQNVKK